MGNRIWIPEEKNLKPGALQWEQSEQAGGGIGGGGVKRRQLDSARDLLLDASQVIDSLFFVKSPHHSEPLFLPLQNSDTNPTITQRCFPNLAELENHAWPYSRYTESYSPGRLWNLYFKQRNEFGKPESYSPGWCRDVLACRVLCNVGQF